MAAQAVPRLREALGDEGVDELITLVDERLREQAVPRDEYHQVIAHLQRIDDRFIEMDRHFEVRFEQMSRHFGNRFDKMEQRVESRIDRRFGEMDRRLDRMDQRLDEMHDRMLGAVLVAHWFHRPSGYGDQSSAGNWTVREVNCLSPGQVFDAGLEPAQFG